MNIPTIRKEIRRLQKELKKLEWNLEFQHKARTCIECGNKSAKYRINTNDYKCVNCGFADKG